MARCLLKFLFFGIVMIVAGAGICAGAALESSPGWKMPSKGEGPSGKTQGRLSDRAGRRHGNHHGDRFQPGHVKYPRQIGPLYPWGTLWYSSFGDDRSAGKTPLNGNGRPPQRPEIVLNPDIFNPEPKDARIIELNQREGNYEKGLRAYRAGDYHHAFNLLQSEARYSVVKATLGFMYFMGLGVTRDYEKAIEWFMAAALQGHVLAQRNLGNIFAAGYGVEQDYPEALKWYLMAAQNRDTSAQKRLADMYVLGLGAKPDKEQALRWYRKAADDGDPAAGYYYQLLDNRGLDACQALLIGNLEPESVEQADGSLETD